MLVPLAVDVRALKSRTVNEKPERKRRVGLSEAAQYCGLANRTMYKKTHRREVPHSKVGGRLFFDLDELEAWIDAGRRKTAAEVAEERMIGNK
jgi:excisionase family DNA binding protein